MPDVTTKSYAITADGDYTLKVANFIGRPRTVIIELVDSGGADASITVKARPEGTSVTALPIVYQSLSLNGSAGTGALVSTAITGDSLIAIEADGIEIVLTVASMTAGTVTVTTHYTLMA